MLVFAAIGVFGAGMLAIAAGIPIKEFGFGNTLILSGVLAWCTGAIMLTLWACFRELNLATTKAARPARSEPAAAPERDVRAISSSEPASASGWPESIPERAPPPPPTSAPPSPAPPAALREPRRNMLFASNRRPRETAAVSEAPIAPAPAAAPLDLRPTTTAEEPRPAPRRIESPPPRTVRPVSTVGPRDPVSAPPPPAPAPPPAAAASPAESPTVSPARESEPAVSRNAPGRSDTSAAVTVLKSGVVDGMAYWLYSDGSIEAQMPEGMMRFTSIDELRAHLDRRP